MIIMVVNIGKFTIKVTTLIWQMLKKLLTFEQELKSVKVIILKTS